MLYHIITKGRRRTVACRYNIRIAYWANSRLGPCDAMIADASPQGRRAMVVAVGFAIGEGPTSIEGNPYRRSARKTFVSAGRSRSGIDDFVIVTSAARGGNDF
jgi:hypothetical protein